MKLAGIVPYVFLPYQSGGQKYIAQLYAYLGQNVEVHIIASKGNNVSLAGNYQLHALLGSSVFRYCNPLIFFRVKKLLKKENIETVIFEHPYHAWLMWLLKKSGFTTVLHSHNIEYARFRSIGKWWWPLLKRYEYWAFNTADIAFFISEDDRLQGIADFRLPAEKCHVIPYGTGLQYPPQDKKTVKQRLLQEWQQPLNSVLLLFTAHYAYQPNIDAATYIIEHIIPKLDGNTPFVIVLTGKGLPQHLQQRAALAGKHPVIYTGFVEDIEPYFTAADILLNPVLSGGGVKTKLIEAIAHGATVVSTATGAKGVEESVCSPKLYIVEDNDWAAFAKQIEACAHQQDTTASLFYNTFYWGNIATTLIRILKAHA
jgi:glycosyltransferase involved in cell wall biosynthesis